MAGGQGPEYWIDELVEFTLSEATHADRHQEGFLVGINEVGVTLLMGAVVRSPAGIPQPAADAQYVFYPWHRIMLIARAAGEEDATSPEDLAP